MNKLVGIVLLAAFALAPRPAFAASDCEDAVREYQSAMSDISSALTRYARCLRSSDGRDDCSSQFRQLKSAQDDLESAVSEVDTYCET